MLIIHQSWLHRGAVLSVVMSSTGEQCFSGGVDGTIQCWNTPNPNIDPYDSYGNNDLMLFLHLKMRVFNLDCCKWRWLSCVFSDRPISVARSIEWAHWLSLGFGVQQRTPAPSLLLCRWDSTTVGPQHHLTRPGSFQWKQKYRIHSSNFFSLPSIFV